MTKKPTLLGGIKAKLISATCMLLVAVIMVVSSTYAWFTLSTAPEVTGITTAVGANGALEIALVPAGGVTSIETSTTNTDSIAAKNVTWGNLIDLSDDAVYGLDKIVLYPSTLNEANGSFPSLALKTPSYGSDGRITMLNANTSFGKYENGKFMIGDDDDWGVRAVGVSSGLSDRQLAYRNAKSTAANAMVAAQKAASESLAVNGNALANIAISHAANSGKPEDVYTEADVNSLLAIVNDLTKTGGVFAKIEESALNYIVAYVASGVKSGDAELFPAAAYSTVQSIVDASNGSLDTFKTNLNASTAFADLVTVPGGSTLWDVIVPPTVQNIYTILYDATNGAVIKANDAKTKLTGIQYNETKTELVEDPDEESGFREVQTPACAWSDISDAMGQLVNTSNMTVNNIPVANVRDQMSALINSVAGKGLIVSMPTGSGVYADVADCCGDYTAEVKIKKVEYNGLVLENMDARMETKTTVNPAYLATLGAAVNAAGAPASEGGDTAKPMSEFYGYVIDMAFRTNAADSSLLLQTTPVDRIYSDNTNETTMGHGSTMTFKSNSASFKNQDVLNLMEHLRVVFFTPDSTGAANAIIARAKLDTVNFTVDAEGNITCNLYLYTEKTMIMVEDTNGVAPGATGYIETLEEATAEQIAAGVNLKVVQTVITEQTEAAICALTQNVATAVSALVYLDGETIENKDVAAAASTSMSGKMNLQFSSSATLVPMEYADLHTPNTPAQGGENP